MSTLEQMGLRVARGSAEGMSAPVREAIRLHLADIATAWVAGARTHEGRELLEAAAKGDQGPFGTGLLSRVALHCALTRLSEIDDIHLAAGTTPGAALIPTALTLAAAWGESSVQHLEAAIAAGYDAMVRLSEEMGGAGILYRGIWPTYFNAPIGAAAVASRLLGLDPVQTAHALGLALVVAAPNVGQQLGKTGRWLLFGGAVRNGVMAALSAREGFTADLGLLDKPFHAVFGLKPDTRRLLESLDKPASILEVSFKPWCAARQTMAAAQGLKELLSQGLQTAQIEAIHVAVPPAYLAMVNHGVVAGDRSSHMTSLPYQLVLAALAPEMMNRLDFAPQPTPPEHQALMARITVAADETLMAYFPQSWPARLEVKARSGTIERLVTNIPGDPARAFDRAQVRHKMEQVLSPLLAASEVRSICNSALQVFDDPAGPRRLVDQIVQLQGS